MTGRIRGIALSLAVVMIAGGTALGAPIGSVLAQDADPAAIDLAIPAAGAASGTITTTDTPPDLPEVLDADPLIAAANAAADALPADRWEVDALASTLAGQADGAFTFVRDAIGFDPYAGVLRGAEGTLAARAGNSWDRALLLVALLRTNGETARIAEGVLDPTTADAVLDRALDAPSSPLPGAGQHGITLPLATAVQARATRDLALLEPAFVPPLLDPTTAPDDRAEALAAIGRHAWVQVERDGAWVDLDPTLVDAVPGAALTTATATYDEVPDDALAAVTVRLVRDSLVNDAPETATVLEATLPAASAADQQVLLYFGPSSGGGGGLLSVGGPDVVIPVLSVGGDTTLGTEFIVSASEGGGLLGGTTDTDLVRLILEVDSVTPAGETVTGRQVLLDRATPEARAAGTIAQAELLPPSDPLLPDELRAIRHLLVSTGGVSPRATNIQRAWGAWTGATQAADPAAIADTSVEHAYWPAGIVDQELVVGSELAVLPGVDDTEVRAFAAQPRVYVVSAGTDPVDPTRLATTIDLLIDPVRVLAHDGAPADAAARHRAWYGVLQSALETEHGLAAATVFDPADRDIVGASLAITGAPLTAVAPGATADLPVGTPATLAQAVADGSGVIVAGDPAAARAWWEVAADGTVRAILAPTFGGVGGIGGGRPPGIPRVNPPQQLPNKPPQPPRVPVKPTAPRPAPQPAPSKPQCTGNEQTILQRCVAFFTNLTISQVFLPILMGALASVAIGVLIALFAGA
jgi:transglutaminase-like putative cysteine protease